MSIKHKLLAVISVLIFLSVMLVAILTYENDRRHLLEQSISTTEIILEQISLNIDTYLSELFSLCLSPYYNKQVMSALEQTPETAAEMLAKQRTVEGFLQEVLTVPRSDILRAHILTDVVYSSSKTRYPADIPEDFQQTDWYRSAMETDKPVFIPASNESQGKNSLSVFSVVQKLRSTQNADRVLGVIRVDANFDGIKSVCDRVVMQEESALLLFGSDGIIIYEQTRLPDGIAIQEVWDLLAQHTDNAFSAQLGDDVFVINRLQSDVTDWQLVNLYSMRTLTGVAMKARNRAILLAILCAGAGAALAVLLARIFLRPIFQITQLMKEVQKGDLSVRANVSGKDELAFMANSFNEMTAQIHREIERNKRLAKQIYEARYLEKEAQYAALCSQIQPHFLFNALNTISLLIKCKRTTEAVQCIEMLAVLLRGMVNTDRDISLSAEMKIVESYLVLQSKRIDALSYSLEDASEYADVMIPAMSIQPLIENAIVHGYTAGRRSMEIRVAFFVKDGVMHITVIDNGSGIAAEKLELVRKQLNADTLAAEQTSGGGVGLVNISRRFKLKYGMEYGIAVEQTPGGGTTVTLRLPFRKENADVPGTDR